MYEADDNSFMLDGTNSRTSEKLVYMAEIKEEDALETASGLSLICYLFLVLYIQSLLYTYNILLVL